jgi:hypothetical protein
MQWNTFTCNRGTTWYHVVPWLHVTDTKSWAVSRYSILKEGKSWLAGARVIRCHGRSWDFMDCHRMPHDLTGTKLFYYYIFLIYRFFCWMVFMGGCYKCFFHFSIGWVVSKENPDWVSNTFFFNYLVFKARNCEFLCNNFRKSPYGPNFFLLKKLRN